MLRLLVFIGLCACSLAAKLEITADSFEASKASQEGVFIGNVQLKKGADYLKCARLALKTDKDSKIISYEATQARDFKINLKDKSYQGKAAKIIYDARKKMYFLSGDVQINEGAKVLRAESISIDEARGSYVLKGKNQAPVKLIFEVKE